MIDESTTVAPNLTSESTTAKDTAGVVYINGLFNTTTEQDVADELIKRIQRIATENGCTMQQAAWAILRTESSYPNPHQEPFPE